MSLENNKKYVSRLGREHSVDKMSVGYLKNQIEYISRTNINEEYLATLKQEFKEKTKPIFIQLKDEHRD